MWQTVVGQVDRDYVGAVGLAATLRRLGSYAFFEGRPATTRGQWFNGVVAANLRWGQRTGGRLVDRPIFILGVGRSGTTHLGRLLSAHPEVGWLNEPKLMWSRIIRNEDVSGFYSPTGRFVLTSDDATPDVQERAKRAFGYYLSAVRASRLVDKYPEMTYRVEFLRALFPDARLIAIVRRPEDFVNSVVDWNVTHATANQDWWGVDRRKWRQYMEQLVPREVAVAQSLADLDRSPTEAEMAATEWVVGMRALLRDHASIDLMLNYERLALSPRDAIADVLAACALDRNERVLALASESTSSRLRESSADFGALTDVVAETRAALRT